MTSEKTITLTRREYDALIERNSQLEDMLAAQDADDGVRVPHEVVRLLTTCSLSEKLEGGMCMRECKSNGEHGRSGICAASPNGIESGLSPRLSSMPTAPLRLQGRSSH